MIIDTKNKIIYYETNFSGYKVEEIQEYLNVLKETSKNLPSFYSLLEIGKKPLENKEKILKIQPFNQDSVIRKFLDKPQKKIFILKQSQVEIQFENSDCIRD